MVAFAAHAANIRRPRRGIRALREGQRLFERARVRRKLETPLRKAWRRGTRTQLASSELCSSTRTERRRPSPSSEAVPAAGTSKLPSTWDGCSIDFGQGPEADTEQAYRWAIAMGSWGAMSNLAAMLMDVPSRLEEAETLLSLAYRFVPESGNRLQPWRPLRATAGEGSGGHQFASSSGPGARPGGFVHARSFAGA